MNPRFIGNEKKYMIECIDSNFVSSVGEFTGRFGKMCSGVYRSKVCRAVMNGTAALHISLLLAGVERGDEVISQALTFIATANAISYTGAYPVSGCRQRNDGFITGCSKSLAGGKRRDDQA
jgi:dTDP-4-amino-4,6-dideoxygalactose transaminase